MKLIMMKRTILTLLALLAAVGLRASDSLSVSLLTCSPGRDAASSFGHSAIRITDSTTGRDLVFNYGTYSFKEPHFLLKFLRGNLNYCLSISHFSSFKRSYENAGRGIIEQPLNLTPAQKADIRLFLMENAREENRYYRYDFLQDNCATRIRDIFHRGGFTGRDTLTEKTYREELTDLVGDRRWMMFGIDLLLGARVDRRITSDEAMFLPHILSRNLAYYTNDLMDGSPLLASARTITEPAPDPGKLARAVSKAIGPFAVFTILLLLYLAIFIKTSRKWKAMSIFSTVIYSILGAGGIILTLMWAATEHLWTAANWNLLWMNPLMLLPVFMRNGVAKNLTIDILTAIAALGIVFSWVIPQTFHPAVPVIVMLLVLLALSRRSIYRKY